MILKFKAKIIYTSEEVMELEAMDMGNISKTQEWVWRMTAIPVEQVYKVISYSKTKSIVQLYDSEKIMVLENFDSLYERWKLALAELPPQVVQEEEAEYNQVDEETSEDDDD